MDVEIMLSFWEFSSNGISILNLRKDAFSDKAITLMLFYWAHSVSLEQFCEILEFLLISNPVNVIVGDFNYDRSKVSTNKIVDHLKDYAQVVNEPMHISGSLIDHIYIKNTLLKDFAFNVKVQNMYFLNYDAVKIVLKNKKVDFSVSKSTESYLFM